MPGLKHWMGRFSALWRSREIHDEIAEELRFHVERRTEENQLRGMPPDLARREAQLRFGSLTQIREQGYAVRGGGWLESVVRDAHYGVRTMRKAPAFTAVALASLALGIGANTAIFQLLDSVRLRTLPVKNPQGLYEVKMSGPDEVRGSVSAYGQLTNPLWEQIRDRQQAFSEIFAWGKGSFNLANGGEVRYAQALLVSGSFFHVLGLRPVQGRFFTLAEDSRGCGASGAVISYSFWQREFGGDPNVAGRKLTLDSHPVEVIGVAPADFFGLVVGQSFDIAVPLCAEPLLRGEDSDLDNGTAWWLVVIGRLKPGWSADRASSELASISPGVFQATLPPKYPPESVKGYLQAKLATYPAGLGFSALRTAYSGPLALLLGTAGLVLLIACTNLASLMLARASAREREIAVRLALGASRPRLVRQLMTESLLVALTGSLLGLGLARVLGGFLVSFLSTNENATFLDLHPDWRVLGFNGALAILTCLLFGLAPALRATGSDPGTAMKSGSRGMTPGREPFGLRKMLIVAQISLSLVLLSGAFLLSRSLQNLLTMDAGFHQENVVVAGLDLSPLNLPADRRVQFKQELLDRLRSVPGVQAAASAEVIPISGNSWTNDVWMENADPSSRKKSSFNRVSPDYFKALQTPLLSGRDFNDHDTATALKVAIVNQAFAQHFTNGANPIGRRIWRQRTPEEPQTDYEIVGLVRNTKYWDIREDFRPIIYLPALQDPRPDTSARILIRSHLPPADIIASAKHTLAAANPEINFDFDILTTQIQNSLLRERLMAVLSGFFGFLAGLLVAIGLFGVISYTVARRTTEIGIRMALGADRKQVLRLIWGEATVLIIAGLGVGAGLTLLLTKAASGLLFGLTPHDPLSLLVAFLLLASIATMSSYLPARRATRVDPLIALRWE